MCFYSVWTLIYDKLFIASWRLVQPDKDNQKMYRSKCLQIYAHRLAVSVSPKIKILAQGWESWASRISVFLLLSSMSFPREI